MKGLAFLLLLTVLCGCLLSFSFGQYTAQLYPSPLPSALPSTCSPLTASSALVAQYGSQYIGSCAYSFCYQLYTTPFPNQDPNAQAYSASGFFFTSTTTSNVPSTYSFLDQTYPSNNVAYTITGIVGQRQQLYLDWNTSCGGNATLTAQITGLTPPRGNSLTSTNDNYLLLQYPYLTLAGISYNINATYNANWLAAPSLNASGVGVCRMSQVQVAATRLTQTGATYSSVKMLQPISSSLGEWYMGQTNFANINVQPYVEGTTSVSFPTCQAYTPPQLRAVNVGFTGTVPSALGTLYSLSGATVPRVSPVNSCLTAQVLVHGPYQRVGSSQTAVYSSYVVSNVISGTRTYTSPHNISSVAQLLGIFEQPLVGPATASQTTTVVVLPLNRLWVDNAFHINATGSVFVSASGGLGFTVSGPVTDFTSPTATTFYQYSLYGGSLTSSTQYNEQGLNVTLKTQSTIQSGNTGVYYFNLSDPLVCSLGFSPMQPLVTNLLDSSGYTQVGLIYSVQAGAVDLTPVTDGVSAVYQPVVRPAFAICMAALLTLDTTVVGGHPTGSPPFASLNVYNVSGWRTFVGQDGVPHVSRLASVSSYSSILSSVYYVQLSNQPSLSLPFLDPLWTAAGNTSQTTATFVPQPTLHSGTVPFIEQVGSGAGEPFFYQDTPPQFSLVILNGAWNPQQFCPQDASILPIAPGFSSATALPPATSSVAFAYLLLPSSFQPGNEWAVCASGLLTLSPQSQPLGPAAGSLGSFFSVTGASGTRAFLDLTRFTANVSQITGVAAPGTVQGLSPDNAVQLMRPFLSPSGLALTLDSVPTFSSGAYGPASLVLGVQQTFPSGSNPAMVLANYVELSSPDVPATSGIFFTLEASSSTPGGSSAAGQLECSALVNSLAQHEGQPSTFVVPFSYYYYELNGGGYTVCAQGTLTVVSLPFELSSGPPAQQVYIVVGASGTRTWYDVKNVSQTNNIIGIATTRTLYSNLLYINASNSNYFPGGLSFLLDSPEVSDSEGQPGVSESNTVTVTTSLVLLNTATLPTYGLEISESGFDLSGYVPTSAFGLQLPSSVTGSTTSTRLPVCPVTAPYPTSLNVTVLYKWQASLGNATVCMAGSLVLGSTIVALSAGQTLYNLPKPWYPVLQANGTRVYTDVNGQSFVQTVLGVSPVGSFIPSSLPSGVSYSNAGHNDNMLAALNGTLNNATSLLSMASSTLGTLFTLDSAPWYPTNVVSFHTSVLLGYTSTLGVMDPWLGNTAVPTLNALYILTPLAQQTNPSAASWFTCPVSSSATPPVLPNPAVPYYWYYNNPLLGVGRECMSGTVTLGSTIGPSAGGGFSFPILNITGQRSFYMTLTNTTYVNTITGLSTQVAGVEQRLTLSPPFVTALGFGLQFDSTLMQPFNPNDPFTDSGAVDLSSTYSYTALQYVQGVGVAEVHQYQWASTDGVFNLSLDPTLQAQCTASRVTQQVPPTAWSQVMYWINGSFSFCGSLLVEYDLSSLDGNGFYQVVAVQGNRSWIPYAGAVPQVQTVLGLAPAGTESNGQSGLQPGNYGDNLFSPNCPYFDGDGVDIEVSCPSCPPAGQSPINLWRYSSDCDSYVNEDTWYHTYYDTSHSITAAAWAPGQPLPLGNCPTGQVASSGPPAVTTPTIGLGPPTGVVASYTTQAFAYALQGAPLSATSPSRNSMGLWSSVVSGVWTLNPVQVTWNGVPAYQIIGGAGSRTFVSATGQSSITQSIVNVTGFLYANTSAYGGNISLQLAGSSATPQGLSYSSTIVVQLASNATFNASTAPSFSPFPAFERWTAAGGQLSQYVDTVELLPFSTANGSTTTTPFASLLPSVSALQTLAAQAIAAQSGASSLPKAPGVQLSFQYQLSPIALTLSSAASNVGASQQLWSVCATGLMTVNTTQPQMLQGQYRYPVQTVTGQRTVMQLNASLASIVQAYATSPSNQLLIPVTSVSVQHIVGLSAAGLQGADNTVAILPPASSAPSVLSLSPSSGGVGLVLNSAAVLPLASGASYTSQVTLAQPSASAVSLFSASSVVAASPSLLLSEVYGPSSSGLLSASLNASLFSACPNPGTGSSTLNLPASQSYVLVYAFNFSSSSNSPLQSVCTVAQLQVTGWSFQTGFGQAQAVFSATGSRYSYQASTLALTIDSVQGVLNSSYSFLYPQSSFLSPTVVDSNGLNLQLQSGSVAAFYANPSTGTYFERTQAGYAVTRQFVSIAPASAGQVLSQSLCFVPPPPLSSSSSSSTAASSSISSSVQSSSTVRGSSGVSSSLPSTPSSTAGSSTATLPTPTSSSLSVASSTATVSQPSSSSSSSLSGGAVAGIVIGCVIGALLLCTVCFFACVSQRDGKWVGKHQANMTRTASRIGFGNGVMESSRTEHKERRTDAGSADHSQLGSIRGDELTDDGGVEMQVRV